MKSYSLLVILFLKVLYHCLFYMGILSSMNCSQSHKVATRKEHASLNDHFLREPGMTLRPTQQWFSAVPAELPILILPFLPPQ